MKFRVLPEEPKEYTIEMWFKQMDRGVGVSLFCKRNEVTHCVLDITPHGITLFPRSSGFGFCIEGPDHQIKVIS